MRQDNLMLTVAVIVCILSIGLMLVAAPQFNSIKVVLTSAGTAQQVSATALFSSHIVIQADGDNSNNIYVGGSDVDNLIGIVLAPGEKIDLGNLMRKDKNEALDLTKVYFDGDATNDIIRVGYVSRRYKGTEPTNQ